MDEDSELGDFDPQNGDDAQTETEEDQVGFQEEPVTPQRPLGQIRREESEYDREIRPGDTVRDLWGGGWCIVFQRKAETVAEYDRMQDDTQKSLLEYEGNKAMGATQEDAVFQLFYLNKNNTLAGGRSGPYAFPESRICRYAYEATDGWKRGRFQDVIQMNVLEAIASEALATGEPDQIEAVERAVKRAFDSELKDEAFELAEAGGVDG